MKSSSCIAGDLHDLQSCAPAAGDRWSSHRRRKDSRGKSCAQEMFRTLDAASRLEGVIFWQSYSAPVFAGLASMKCTLPMLDCLPSGWLSSPLLCLGTPYALDKKNARLGFHEHRSRVPPCFGVPSGLARSLPSRRKISGTKRESFLSDRVLEWSCPSISFSPSIA